MNSVALGWNGVYISVKSIWPNLSFKAKVSLLIFCLNGISIDITGALKSSPSIVFLFLPLGLLIFALYSLCSYVGYINMYKCYILLLD